MVELFLIGIVGLFVLAIWRFQRGSGGVDNEPGQMPNANLTIGGGWFDGPGGG